MFWLILFVFGLAIGSFLNVVAGRYDGERSLFAAGPISGRSYCPHCKRTLRWFELVPVVSFIMQGGKCRRCHAPIGLGYPAAEIISGLIFVFVPWRIMILSGAGGFLFAGLSFFWVVAFEALFVMSLIDIRLGIIPDELSGFLCVLALFSGIFVAGYLGLTDHSLFGTFADMFGLQGNYWISHLFAALFGGAFFGALIAITRGRGMGMGDLKLAIPLGFFLGWPDILFAIAFAFVIGAAVGLVTIAMGKRTMKGSLPFGPFFALGVATVFFFGYQMFGWYLRL
ncbi:MAG: prepilin peptidase [Candidatus Pacebacteria bacterium]|nr:prepilin peptidase [Candidatus Paceibacterota bacterium]